MEYAGAQSDPIAALLFCGYNHGAACVIVDGTPVVEEGLLLGADEEEIRDRANAAARRLLVKAGLA
jgi:hypothetical protein